MKRIKLKFLDCYKGHVPENDRYYKLLSRHYKVELSDEPDYVVDCGLGTDHLDSKYKNCIKILSTGENMTPDFNLFDYAIGFDFIEFGDRYLRQPLFAFYDAFGRLESSPPSAKELLKREFCSFVVSNSKGDPFRTEFFKALSKYRPVASGGGYLNNIGERVANKVEFCSKFKFNIAFENAVSDGYVTEKIMEPLSVWSVPIYYGSPSIQKDFYPQCMVRVADKHDLARAIDEILYLDTHDEAYLEKCTAKRLICNVSEYDEQLERFLCNIIDRPIESARRLCEYGWQADYRALSATKAHVFNWLRKPLRYMTAGKRLLKVPVCQIEKTLCR